MKTIKTRKIHTQKGIYLIVLCFLSATSLFAQEAKLNQAHDEYANQAYVNANKIYEAVANKGYRSIELFQRLGDGYYFNSNYGEAAKWYRELFSMSEEQPSAYYLRYAQSLKSIGDKQLAQKYYDNYLGTQSNAGKDYVSAAMYLALIEENSGRYDMRKLDINSDSGFDFGGSFLGDETLVFASNRENSSIRNRVSSWDGMPYLNLFEATIDSEGNLGAPRKLKGNVNTRYHESTPSYTADGSKVYFTRNNLTSQKRSSKDAALRLKIYSAQVDENNNWGDVKDLSINRDSFSTAHPALNPEGTKMYFASDRPGGYGQTDLYVVDILEDGQLGNPVNLGAKVNTSGRESFPFVNEKNELYFSSDGHFGLGGFDVFYIKLDDNGMPTGQVLNVGKPINSEGDDLAYIVRNGKGYVSSNRSVEGQDNHFDNIYGFTENKPIKDVFVKSRVYGVITDKLSGFPLPNSTVTLTDENHKIIAEITTSPKGFYEVEVDFNENYIISVIKDDYSGADAFSKMGRVEREHNLGLYKVAQVINIGDDLSSILNIVIYFDLDKHNIRPDAEIELQKLVEALKQNPTMRIDVRSHTDSRASDRYNLTLSNLRAKSTVQYLIGQGIEKSRLTGRGYGETQLVNWCSDGVECSEEQHQQNRRSEFIVLNR